VAKKRKRENCNFLLTYVLKLNNSRQKTQEDSLSEINIGLNRKFIIKIRERGGGGSKVFQEEGSKI
jgi:hypothetical protein